MSKHTQSPWQIIRDNPGARDIAYIHGPEPRVAFEICMVFGAAPESTQEANAKLIAKSPELLSVLQSLCYPNNLVAHDFQKALETGRALLAELQATPSLDPKYYHVEPRASIAEQNDNHELIESCPRSIEFAVVRDMEEALYQQSRADHHEDLPLTVAKDSKP